MQAVARHHILHSMTPHSPVPFPIIEADALDEWEWPAPPFGRHHLPALDGAAQPCRIESRSGACLDMELVRFDAAGEKLVLRSARDRPEVSVTFSRIRRITLTAPAPSHPRLLDASLEQLPIAAQMRDYEIDLAGQAGRLAGRSIGHVERTEGLYLYPLSEDERSVGRAFVPRTACSSVRFGRTALEAAADRWIASPGDLVAAIERQQRMTVRPIGQSMLELGLLTPAQLERALLQPTADLPLGETLVARGIISRTDLQTVLAHKMGYPLVDLTRFPIDPNAVRRLSPRLAHWARAVPLMLDSERLVVAVDKPERVSKLRALHALARLRVVPVLAPKSNIALALAGIVQNDVWLQNVTPGSAFFATTTS